MHQHQQTELDALRDEVTRLRDEAADKDARLSRLEGQLTALVARMSPPGGGTAGGTADDGDGDGAGATAGADGAGAARPVPEVVARRDLLRRGAVAAGAAVAGTAGAAVLGASPAAAANGDPVILGLPNNGQTSPTSIIHVGATGISLFNVMENFLAAGPSMNGVVAGWANTIAKAGVLGYSQNSAGAGVYGYGGNGAYGVFGTSSTNAGVAGTSTAPGYAGVSGATTSAASAGVLAMSTAPNGTALQAVATQGKAITATATNGVCITALASGATSMSLLASTATADLAAKVQNTGAGKGLTVDAGGDALTVTSTGATAVPLTATTAVGSVAAKVQNTGGGDGLIVSAGATAVTVTSTGGSGLVATANTAESVAILGQTSGTDSTAIVGLHSAGGTAISANSTGAHLFLAPNGAAAPTRAIAAGKGAITCDTNGDLWLCTVSGTPGTWRKLAGPATSGALHTLATPVRVFDSRAGNAPLNVAKGAFVNQTKVIDAKNNSSGVPAGATAVLVNLAVTNTNSGGFGALWTNGVAWPGTANINWSSSATTISNSVLTAVDANALLQCRIAGTADVIIDVIAYYR